MTYSFLFSFLIENIPENRFDEISTSIVKFLIGLKIDIKKIFLYKDFGLIEIQDCDVLYNSDFINFAENNFKKIVWRDGFLPFEFGAVVTDGIPTQSFDGDDYKNFKINEVVT
jgi:hypothetical protein